MFKILILLFAFFTANSLHAQVAWHPKSMKVEQARNGIHGNHIKITQELPKGEFGWKMSRFNLPSNWEIKEWKADDKKLLLTLITGKSYILTPSNFGQISFELLDGGNKEDDKLLAIWNKHAATN